MSIQIILFIIHIFIYSSLIQFIVLAVSPPSIPPSFSLPFLSSRSYIFPRNRDELKETSTEQGTRRYNKTSINNKTEGASPVGEKRVPQAGKTVRDTPTPTARSSLKTQNQ